MNDDERRLICRSRQERRLVFTRFGDADAWGGCLRTPSNLKPFVRASPSAKTVHP